MRTFGRLILAMLGMLVGVSPAMGQTIADGDTLKLNGVVYRLWGIDAPETKQACPDGWQAGRLARRTCNP